MEIAEKEEDLDLVILTRPELANNLYEEFVKKAKDKGVTVGTGQFAAHMMVELTNDGPVTILLDSSKSF